MSKALKKEIYLVVSYGLDGETYIFKAYEDKYMAQEVVKTKQKSANEYFKVLPICLVPKAQRET